MILLLSGGKWYVRNEGGKYEILCANCMSMSMSMCLWVCLYTVNYA